MERLKNIARSAELQREARQGAIDFLEVELQTAMTFATIAKQAGANTSKRARNLANSRKAYDTFVSGRERYAFTEPEQMELKELEPGVQELKRALEQLGEKL